jgi:hypothetical protein
VKYNTSSFSKTILSLFNILISLTLINKLGAKNKNAPDL